MRQISGLSVLGCLLESSWPSGSQGCPLSFYLFDLGPRRKSCGEFLCVSLRKETDEISVVLRTSSHSHQLCSHRGTPPPCSFQEEAILHEGRYLHTNHWSQYPGSSNCVQSTIIKLRDQDRGVSPTSRAPFQRHKLWHHSAVVMAVQECVANTNIPS